ncbi:hypothetical protein D082_13540 [Synechocystis sp. PCC 6714]|nr:hypothetical protein D082_13540 [Synechocystis sp. PCC 6714]
MEKRENLTINKNVLLSIKRGRETALLSLAQQWIQWVTAQNGFD